MHVHVKLVTEQSWKRKVVHGVHPVCRMSDTIPRVYLSGIYSQLKSKGENNDVVRITHKTAYLGLMQHWQPGNQEDAHEFMVIESTVT